MPKRKDCTASAARTPGPWHMAVGLASVRIINDAGITIASTPCFDRQADADARLLAAAPDLLEQLNSTIAELVRLHAQSSGEEAESICGTIERARFVVAALRWQSMETKNPSTVDAVEQLATRLWKRAAESSAYGSAADEWRKTQDHLCGVSDALFICGKTDAAELANELGFLANRRAQLELEQS